MTTDKTPVKTDWKVGDFCYIDGTRHIVEAIYRPFNSLPDCYVGRSVYFEDMKVGP